MIMNVMQPVRPRIKVEAKVMRACTICGDSGFHEGKYHEDLCPKCGAPRPAVEDQGLIYDNHPWFQLKRKIKNYIRRFI